MIDEEPSIGAFTPARHTGDSASIAETFAAHFDDAAHQGGMMLDAAEAERLYDERIDLIERETGKRLENPYRTITDYGYRNTLRGGTFGVLQEDLVPGESQVIGVTERKRDGFKVFDEEVERLAQEFPDKADVIRGPGPVLEPLHEKRRQREQRAIDVLERSPLTYRARIPKWVPFIGGELPLNPIAIAGGFAGMMTDPAQAAANLVVGPFRPVAVGAKNVLWNGVKVAVANMAIEGAQQPIIQEWRSRAGLEHGAELGIRSTLLAGALGGAIDVGVRGGFRGAQRGLGRVPRVDEAGGVIGWERPERGNILDRLEEAARTAPKGSTLRRAYEGDDAALEELAREAGIADTPEARGAIRAMSLEDNLRERIPGADDGEGVSNLAQALRSATDDEEPPARGVDPLAPDRAVELVEPGDGITTAAQLRHHREALADLEARRVDPDLQEHHRRMIKQLEERLAYLEELPEGRPLRKSGDRFEVEGKPVSIETMPARNVEAEPSIFQFKRESTAAQRLLRARQWDPAAAQMVMVYEYADGRRVIADGHQRLALAKRLEAEGHEPIELQAITFREADGWDASDVRALAAKKNLQEGSGDVLDAAKIQRERPDIIDRTVPISTAMMRQSRHLARLSDEAFAMVEAGTIRPNHAALVGQLVDDRSRHVEMIEALTKARPANVREARLIIGDLLQTGHQLDAQRAVLGVDTISTELLRPRAQVLDHALRLLREDANIFALITEEAARIEQLGNRLRIDSNAERALQSEAVGSLMETLASRPGPLSDWLTEAARQVYEGANPRTVSESLVETVRDALEREGLDALRVRPRAPLRGEGLDDPGGPEARAQVEELMRELNENIEAATRDIANRNLDRWLWWQEVNGRDVPTLTLEQRSAIIRRMTQGEDISTAFDDVVVRQETAEPTPEAPPEEGGEQFVDSISGETFNRGDVEAIVEMWRYVQEVRRIKPPQRLSSFIVDRGGINDEGGDVRHILGRPKDRPGLISRNGMSLDDAAYLAWESGYLRTYERPSINDFLEALDEDLAGNHVYSVRDEDLARQLREADEIDGELAKIGIFGARNEDDVRRQFIEALGEAEAERAAGPPGSAEAPGRTAAETQLEEQGGPTGPLSRSGRDEGDLDDFDEEAPFALAAAEAGTQRRIFDELGFYSAALEAARRWRQTKGTPAQIRQHLKASGVKDAEIRATGLDTFLDNAGATVSRDDVVRHLEANRVRLREVRFDVDADYDNRVLAARIRERADMFSGDERREMLRLAHRIAEQDFDGTFAIRFIGQELFDRRLKSEATRNEVRAIIADLQSRQDARPRTGNLVPRFREYSIDVANPTYAETVVHLPRAIDRLQAEREAFLASLYAKYGTHFLSRENLTPEERAQLSEIEDRINRSHGEDFEWGHFSEAVNPIGHIRHALQKDANGAPVLLIDELQFDWAQYIRDLARDHHAMRMFGRPFRRLTQAERAEVSKAVSQEPASVTMAARKAEMIEARRQELDEVVRDAWAVRDKLRKAMAGTGEEVSPPFNPGLMTVTPDKRVMMLGKVPTGKRRAVARIIDDNNIIAERWRSAEFTLSMARREPLTHPLVETTQQALETMLRRAVRIAIDAGAEKVAFTPGAVQALRFPDGTRIVTGLRYNPERNTLMVKRRGSSNWTHWREPEGSIAKVTPDDLPRLIGSDMADRLLRQTPVTDPTRGPGWHQLTKLRDAVVGGTGFRTTYDQIYPRTLLKILRRIDPSIKQASEELASSLDGRTLRLESADRRRPGEPVSFHTFRLTDNVKEYVVGQGLPMFALSPDLRSRMEFDRRLAETGTAEVAPDVIQTTHAALAPLARDLPEGWRVAALKSVRPIRSSNPDDAGKVVVTLALPDGGEARFKAQWSRIANARALTDSRNRLLVALRFATSDVDGRELHVSRQIGDQLGERSVVLFDRSLRGEFWHELFHIRRRLPGGDRLAGAFARIAGHAESLGILDQTHREYMRAIGRPGYGEGTPDIPLRELYSAKYSTRADIQELVAEEAGAHLVELLEHGVLRVADVEPIIDDLRAVFGRVPGDRPVDRMSAGDVLEPLEMAQYMERHGATPQVIRRVTGLQRDNGGQWQGEGRRVPPIEADVITGRVDAVLDRTELFSAYPALRSFDLRLELRRGEPEASVDFDGRRITASAETVEAAMRKIAGLVRSEAQRNVRLTAGSTQAALASLSRRIVDDIDEEAARLIERVSHLEGRLSSLDAILHGEHPEVAALRRRLDVLQSERKLWSGSMLRPVSREPAVPSLMLRRPAARMRPDELASRLSRSADDLWESGARAGEVADAVRHEFSVDVDAATVARNAAWNVLIGRDREVGELIDDAPIRAVDAGEISDPIAALTRADIENLGPAEMAALLKERGRAGIPERLRPFEESNRMEFLKSAVEACRA